MLSHKLAISGTQANNSFLDDSSALACTMCELKFLLSVGSSIEENFNIHNLHHGCLQVFWDEHIRLYCAFWFQPKSIKFMAVSI